MKWKLDKRKGWIFLLLFVVFSTPGLAQDIEEDLGDFSELKVYNGVQVEVIPSESNRIHITGYSKDKVKYEVVENRLEIRLSLKNIWSDDNTLVRVYARDLQVIDANSSAIIDVTGELLGESFTFRSQEGGAIYALTTAVNLQVKAVTGGVVQLRGKGEHLVVDVNTGGKFFGQELKVKDAEITTGTGGLSEVNVSKYAKATARLGGVIDLYGNPENLDRKTTLGGKISEKNE